MAAPTRRRPRTSLAIIDGSKTFAFAQLEKNSRYDLPDVATTAKKKGDGWVIDGEKFVVLNGENADTFIVTARTKGEPARQKRHRRVPGARERKGHHQKGLSDPGRPACRRRHLHRR